MLTIKKAHHGEFRNLLSAIRLAMLDNRSYAAFPKKKFNYLFILKQLQQGGFIEGYDSRGEILIIHIKQTHWKTFQIPAKAFSDIKPLHLNKLGTGNKKQLKKFQKVQSQTVTSIISTDAGVISGNTAADKKIGGIPLFKIY